MGQGAVGGPRSVPRSVHPPAGGAGLQGGPGGGPAVQCDRSLSATEEIIGLGNYGRTLTVLTALDIEEQIEELNDEGEQVESWTPRLGRR